MTLERYSRQILFPGVGEAGQRKIRQATVGLLGLGALGSTLADLMTRSGVGRLVAVDRDIVEPSNLHRQTLYTQADADAGLPKAVAARKRLREINPDVDIECLSLDLGPDNALDVFEECDLILDGADGFETRYLLNDVAIHLGIPWIYGACVAARGMTATIIPGATPCLTCLFPEPPPPGSQETCETGGVIPPVATLVASLQATEALKLLVGDRPSLRRGLLSIELWPFRTVLIGESALPSPDCPACQGRKLRFLAGSAESRSARLCGRNVVQIVPREPLGRSLRELAPRLESLGRVRTMEGVLHLEIDGLTLTLFPDGRALVRGTDDPGRARGLYSRLFGS
ncbi:MAG TPA: thiazole biosynthesis adenylyltransferase ThiF [Planctomycetes bacterium]|nr:thiazole biosynthesis adenylyltransferase ThiF [Planctomycetota bacterium]